MRWAIGLVMACLAATASAEQTPAMKAASDAATTIATRIAAGSSGAGKVPLLTDPADAALIRRAFDRNVIRGLPTDLPVVATFCNTLVQAQQGYANLSGRRAGETTAQATARFKGLENEVIIATLAIDLCMKRMMRAGNAFVGAMTPDMAKEQNVIDGATQMRGGATQTVIAMTQLIGDSSLSMANRTTIMDGLYEDSLWSAMTITAAQRAEIVKAIDAIAPSAPAALKQKLIYARRTYAQADCALLCKVGS